MNGETKMAISDTSAERSVLQEVRRALGRSETIRPAPLGEFEEEFVAQSTLEVVERFVAEATALGCLVHKAQNGNKIAETVAGIIEAGTAKDIVLSKFELFDQLELRSRLQMLQIRTHLAAEFSAVGKDRLIKELADSPIGLTAADWAIAETGTVVLTSDEDGALLVSLLPPVHIALLRTSRIRQSLAEVLAELSETRVRCDLPFRSATFISGPSRTSDVELTLSIGVHGPKELHVIILED